MSIRDSLLADFDHEMGTTRRLLERLPDDRLSWKPHPRSMTLGGLATHLSNIPTWGVTILGESSFDLAGAPPPLAEKTSRAEILASFDGVCRATRATMDKTDAEYESPWTLKRGGKDPRRRRCSAEDAWRRPLSGGWSGSAHAPAEDGGSGEKLFHRGQLSLYLRLNDLPVPAIYGPSADEG